MSDLPKERVQGPAALVIAPSALGPLLIRIEPVPRDGVRAATVHPGGVKTNIVANARYRADHRGEHADVESAAAAFAQIARTTPEKAAKIIHRGIEDGRSRIRVGSDAVLFDLLARFAPNRYYDIIERLETLLRRAT